MTSDDQQFLDLLASIPQDMAAYGGRIADYIEKHTNAIASEIRDALDSATWLPESFKPPRNPHAHHFFARTPPPPQGLYEKTVAFISRNRTAIAVAVAFAGTTVYLVHRRKRAHARKRRAKKLPNGAKKEIVVLACSTFHDPLTRSLAVDLERRGYVVYVTVSSTEEDSLVQQEAKQDLRPLWMDLTSTVPNPSVDIHPDLDPIKELLSKGSVQTSPGSQRSGTGSSTHNMNLAGIIVFPGCSGYPMGPLALLHPSDVVDSVNTRLLSPLITVQQFLPLLARNSQDPKCPSSIVIAYPSIPQSLTPPGEVPEAVISSSLSALASSLRREVRAASANIVVSELKLGNFDLGSVYSKSTNRSISPEGDRSLVLPHWHSSQRAAAQRTRFGQSSLIRGSAAREFHNAVFDALAPPQTFKAFGKYEWQVPKRSEVVFVGSGARVYDIVGKVVPHGLISLMMGYRTRRDAIPSPANSTKGSEDIEAASAAAAAARSPSATGLSASNVWGTASATSESGIWEKV